MAALSVAKDALSVAMDALSVSKDAPTLSLGSSLEGGVAFCSLAGVICGTDGVAVDLVCVAMNADCGAMVPAVGRVESNTDACVMMCDAVVLVVVAAACGMCDATALATHVGAVAVIGIAGIAGTLASTVTSSTLALGVTTIGGNSPPAAPADP